MKFASIPVCFLILIACGSQVIAQTNWPPFRGADSLGLLELGMNPVVALQADDPTVHAEANVVRPEKLTATIGDVLIRI
ncbi:MAG: hypothetical protein H7062_25810, partial [Candidatus Saccharimonas sp.]|nr:hypothetical protein [Planctomycetaceae bacterium]